MAHVAVPRAVPPAHRSRLIPDLPAEAAELIDMFGQAAATRRNLDRDAFGSPDLGREAAAQASRARFVLIEDAGHVPWLDQPQRVAAQIVIAIASGH